jgi:hypothetical protein
VCCQSGTLGAVGVLSEWHTVLLVCCVLSVRQQSSYPFEGGKFTTYGRFIALSTVSVLRRMLVVSPGSCSRVQWPSAITRDLRDLLIYSVVRFVRNVCGYIATVTG